METYNRNMGNEQGQQKARRNHGMRGRSMGGIIILLVGSVLLAKNLNVGLPEWLFSWPMLMIVIGVFVGVRHNFRTWGWLIPVFIGSAFLADRFFYELDFRHLVWPIAIMAFGAYMIFRPRRSDSDTQWEEFKHTQVNDHEGHIIDKTAVFGSVKENVLSKNFKGGELVTFFGGSELNLMQADIQGPVVLELTQVFGGSKLIVPANWKVQSSEMVCVFGGIDDKRNIHAIVDADKILILHGTCVFGGLEIKSY